MRLTINNFGGLAPMVDSHLLADNLATVAQNCYFNAGAVGAWHKPSFAFTPAKPGTKRTIYKMGQQLELTSSDYESKYWLHWSEDVDVVRGQIAGNVEESTYFTGESFTGKTNFSLAVGEGTGLYPEVTYPLGVEPPATPLSAIVQSVDGSGTAEDRYYFYTYVNTFGSALEESAPSPATLSPVEVKDGQVVRVTGFVVPPATAGNISHWRLYRTASGTKATDWQLVAEIPINTTVYDDGLLTEELGEVTSGLGWSMPPAGLRGLVNLPNGITAGFVGNDVYFSAPYRPFTFPGEYAQTLDYKIVGMAVFGTTLVVVTQGHPYVFNGIDPAAMSSLKLEEVQACVSKRSIVDIGYGVIYASPDGLVLVDSTGVKLITQAHFQRRDWQKLKPWTITACNYDGRYIFWTDSVGYMFDRDQGFSTTDVYATAAHNDKRNDSLYLQVGPDIVKWDGHQDLLDYTWQSKVFECPVPTSFAWAQVLLDDGEAVTLTVKAKGLPAYEIEVTNDEPFRLPAGDKSKYWQVEIAGTGTVRGVHLATAMAELQNV